MKASDTFNCVKCGTPFKVGECITKTDDGLVCEKCMEESKP